MPASFIRFSSEAGRPDNPIKCLKAVCGKAGRFHYCVCLYLGGNINKSMWKYPWLYVSVPLVMDKSLCCWKHFENTFSHYYSFVYWEVGNEWLPFFWILSVLCWWKLKSLWSEVDLKLGSSRLAGFGPLRAQCTMTTSLHERKHGGCVTQRAPCVTWHTPPQFLWEKNRTLLLMVVCNISLRWNSYSPWFWC